MAAHCGANDCVNFLLEWGADARHRDLEGRNFILLAILNRRTLLVVEQLTKIGVCLYCEIASVIVIEQFTSSAFSL